MGESILHWEDGQPWGKTNSVAAACIYRTQVNLGSDLWVRMSLRHKLREVCEDLTDVTLADEDTNSILTDNANRTFQCGNASDTTWWSTLESSNARGAT